MNCALQARVERKVEGPEKLAPMNRRSLKIQLALLALLALRSVDGFGAIRTGPTMKALGVFRTKGDWEHAYHGFIAKAGFRTCGAAWEGYCRLGRGAMYVTKDASSDGVRGFVPIARLSRSLGENAATADLQEIVRRIDNYDPEKEFVVIFEADGITGVDVLKPALPPFKVAETIAYKKVVASRA